MEKFTRAIAHILALAQKSFDYALHITIESAAATPGRCLMPDAEGVLRLCYQQCDPPEAMA